MNIGIFLSGFFFLFIIITNISSNIFGYKTFGDIDINDQLQEISKYPTKFKLSVALILLEHLGIISLAISLFITFGSYNIILGIVWCIFRIGEASIQIYDKKNYWGLLNIGKKYSDTTGSERDVLIDSGRNILKKKDLRFVIAQLCFSIGTFAYSLLFITNGVVPLIIGWFGIIISIIYGVGNVIFIIKPKIKVIWNIGGLLILLFEICLGGWLLWYSFIIP